MQSEIAEMVRKVGMLTAERERLRAALEFYAEPTNWDSVVLYTVPKGEPNEGAQTCRSGPAWDRGQHARIALGWEIGIGQKVRGDK